MTSRLHTVDLGGRGRGGDDYKPTVSCAMLLWLPCEEVEKFLLSHRVAINSFGLGRLFNK